MLGLQFSLIGLLKYFLCSYPFLILNLVVFSSTSCWFMHIVSSVKWCTSWFCHIDLRPMNPIWLQIEFTVELANSNLFLIRIQIGLYKLLQIDLLRNIVCNLYSILGKSILLFRYISWLADAFFHLIALHILLTSFRTMFKLKLGFPLLKIQTLRYLARSVSFFA